MKRLSIIPLLVLLAACQGQAKRSTISRTKDIGKEIHTIGGDKDKHGCLTSAGYNWSEVRNDCIRLFESGIRLNPAVSNTSSSTLSAFLVLGKDSSRVEVFLPSDRKSVILFREGKTFHKSGSNLNVRETQAGWQLFQDKQLIYQSGD